MVVFGSCRFSTVKWMLLCQLITAKFLYVDAMQFMSFSKGGSFFGLRTPKTEVGSMSELVGDSLILCISLSFKCNAEQKWHCCQPASQDELKPVKVTFVWIRSILQVYSRHIRIPLADNC